MCAWSAPNQKQEGFVEEKNRGIRRTARKIHTAEIPRGMIYIKNIYEGLIPEKESQYFRYLKFLCLHYNVLE